MFELMPSITLPTVSRTPLMTPEIVLLIPFQMVEAVELTVPQTLDQLLEIALITFETVV